MNIPAPGRQYALPLLILAALLGILVACQQAATPAPVPTAQVVEKIVQQTVVVQATVQVEKVVERPVVVTATPAPTASGADKSASQVLRLAFEGGVGRGAVPGQDIGAAVLPVQVFLPPFVLDKTGKLLPGLATGYEANSNNTVFTIKIDPKAVWSDGKAITAQDFVDWYNWVFQPDRAMFTARTTFGPVVGLDEYLDRKADKIEGFKAVNDKTLQITLKSSQGWFPLRLAYIWAAPARADQFGAAKTREEITAVWLKEKAKDLIVSGPFKLTYLEPEPNAIYKWEQNPKWWGDRKPTITRIEGTTIRDFQTMLLLFENGEIDAALQLSGAPAVLLRKNRPETFVEMPAYAFYAQFFDSTIAPTDDPDLRRALLSAINWQQVADVAWEGQMLASNSGSILTPSMPCYDANYKPFPFDAAKAKEYLAKSKYGPTGDKVPKIRILTAGSDPPRIRAAQIIQEMWRTNLGIENVEIKNAETEFQDGQGLVNVRVSSGGAPLPIPALQLEFAGHSKGGGAQFTKINNPDLDKRIDALLAADPKDSKYCADVQATLKDIQDQALVIPTAYIKSYYQVQPWLKNFDRSVSGWYSTLDAYLAKR
ncbi:MAG: ABC transporter substrate-binding protein [Anaerolineae bacterium]|nr:ABC transporter substrate-binding protein [Anaerolineae bacterium]